MSSRPIETVISLAELLLNFTYETGDIDREPLGGGSCSPSNRIPPTPTTMTKKVRPSAMTTRLKRVMVYGSRLIVAPVDDPVPLVEQIDDYQGGPEVFHGSRADFEHTGYLDDTR